MCRKFFCSLFVYVQEILLQFVWQVIGNYFVVCLCVGNFFVVCLAISRKLFCSLFCYVQEILLQFVWVCVGNSFVVCLTMWRKWWNQRETIYLQCSVNILNLFRALYLTQHGKMLLKHHQRPEPKTEKGYMSLGMSKRMSKRISQGSWSGYGAPHWWRISLLPISHWSTQKKISFQTSLWICFLSRFSAQIQRTEEQVCFVWAIVSEPDKRVIFGLKKRLGRIYRN